MYQNHPRVVMLLVHASPTTLARHRHPNLGVLCSPRRVYGDELAGWRWAADNDAFSAWDEGRFRDMLAHIRGRTGCLFVTAPDVVGDWRATTRNFAAWVDELQGLPVAFVGQDDQEKHPVPWDAFDAFFVGGTTTWKMGDGAARLIREAKVRGKWVHMGRVNTRRRMVYAKALGCDSVDGTKFSWFRDTYLAAGLADASAPTQMLLEVPS